MKCRCILHPLMKVYSPLRANGIVWRSGDTLPQPFGVNAKRDPPDMGLCRLQAALSHHLARYKSGTTKMVMIAELKNDYEVVADFIDDTISVIDPSRPQSPEFIFQFLGLSDPTLWIVQYRRKQCVDPLDRFRAASFPEFQIVTR